MIFLHHLPWKDVRAGDLCITAQDGIYVVVHVSTELYSLIRHLPKQALLVTVMSNGRVNKWFRFPGEGVELVARNTGNE